MPPMMSALEDSQLEENWEEVEAEVAAVSETTARSGNSVNPHLESDAETLKLGESCVAPPQKLRRTLKLDPKDVAESETPARSSSEATMIVPALGAVKIPSEEAQLLSPTASLFDWDDLDNSAKLMLLRQQARIQPPWWSQ